MGCYSFEFENDLVITFMCSRYAKFESEDKGALRNVNKALGSYEPPISSENTF